MNFSDAEPLLQEYARTWLIKKIFKVAVLPGGIQGFLFEKLFSYFCSHILIPMFKYLDSQEVIVMDIVKMKNSIQKLKDATNETDWNSAVDHLE